MSVATRQFWTLAAQDLSDKRGLWELMPAGTTLRSVDTCWMVIRGAAEERMLNARGGRTSVRCPRGTLIGASALLSQEIDGYARLLQPSVLVSLDRSELIRLLCHRRFGPELRERLLMLRFPRRSPQVRVLAEDADRIRLYNPKTGTRGELNELGCFLWRHMDGHHTLEQLAQVLGMTGTRPRNDRLLDLTRRLCEAGYIEITELDGLTRDP
ncbi:MAG: hypothetical protein AAFV53_40770 [Myxococcota bacterium]